jgi:ribosomal-protein-alanine N-acetyltransferase
MSIEIETASIRHLDMLYEIEKACFKEEAFSRQQIANLLGDYNSISLVAIEDGRIVGFIIGAIYVERKALGGHVLTIDVLPRYQRKGVGLRLMQAIERIFVEKDVKTCHLEVREDNLKALGLYEKVGYEKTRRLKSYYGRADGLYLRKSLA